MTGRGACWVAAAALACGGPPAAAEPTPRDVLAARLAAAARLGGEGDDWARTTGLSYVVQDHGDSFTIAEIDDPASTDGLDSLTRIGAPTDMICDDFAPVWGCSHVSPIGYGTVDHARRPDDLSILPMARQETETGYVLLKEEGAGFVAFEEGAVEREDGSLVAVSQVGCQELVKSEVDPDRPHAGHVVLLPFCGQVDRFYTMYADCEHRALYEVPDAEDVFRDPIRVSRPEERRQKAIFPTFETSSAVHHFCASIGFPVE